MAKKKDGDTQMEEAAPVPRKAAPKKDVSEKDVKKKVRTSRKKEIFVEPHLVKPVCFLDTEDAPSRTDIVTQARLYGPASIETLAEVMQCGTEASRVAAAKSLLDRGFGKVDQAWSNDAESLAETTKLGEEMQELVPPVPRLDGLAPQDLARISSIVWEEAMREQ